MKKVLALALVLLTMISCRQKNENDVQRFGEPIITTVGTSTGGTKKSDNSFYDFTQAGYLGQLPYITANSASEISEFNTEFELSRKVPDSTITWEYFDTLYADSLSTAQKQNVAVFVLRSKNLIALAREHPDNVKYKKALTKYIDVLVETSYFGYCLLYAALEQCTDSNYAKQRAAEIVDYSITETFHQSFLSDPAVSADWRYRKVEEDLTYLSKLRDLRQ